MLCIPISKTEIHYNHSHSLYLTFLRVSADIPLFISIWALTVEKRKLNDYHLKDRYVLLNQAKSLCAQLQVIKLKYKHKSDRAGMKPLPQGILKSYTLHQNAGSASVTVYPGQCCGGSEQEIHILTNQRVFRRWEETRDLWGEHVNISMVTRAQDQTETRKRRAVKQPHYLP